MTDSPTSKLLTPGQALQQAVRCQNAGQLQDAVRLYRSILRAQPQHPEANHNLGALAVQMNQPAAGLPHFKAALEANPVIGQHWISYIDALIQTGQTDAARQILAQGRQQGLRGEAVQALEERLDGPSDDEINALVILFNQGHYPEIEAATQRLTMRFPMHGFGWKALGAVLKLQGRTPESLLALQKAAELLPWDAEAQSNQGVVLSDLGRLDEAEASHRRALKAEPDYADAHNNLGNTLWQMGRLAEAEASYRRALQVKPDYAVAHYNLGVTLRDMGRLAEAEASYRRAIQFKPDYADAHYNLGHTLKELDRLDEALTSYRLALKAKGDWKEALRRLTTPLVLHTGKPGPQGGKS
jgi:tetratricopeptide (TPR) repeat protein